MKTFVLHPLALAALVGCHITALANLPTGHKVVNGSATVNTFSNGMQVINSPGAIIHWDSFSVGAGKTVRFDQLTVNSAVLNRVKGGRASEILGTLQSNGRVFLINPNGILFGRGSRVDTAGLVASTLDISDEDFLAGNYRFACSNAIACDAGVDVLNPYNQRIVLEDGSEITTRQSGDGGQVWLLARDRITSAQGSKVDTPAGQFMAAAAREVVISSPSVGQMRFTLSGITGSRIDLAGDIDVARGAAGFFADTVRLAGRVHALSETGAAGQIVAQAGTDVLIEGDARLNVSGVDGADAGAIRLQAGRRIVIASSVDVAADGGQGSASDQGGRGGLIDLTAPEIDVRQVDALPADVLHAEGHDAAGLNPGKFGQVVFNEGTDYTFEVVNLLTISGQGSYALTSSKAGSSSVISEKDSTVLGTWLSGDGSYLIVTKEVNKTSQVTTTAGVFGSQSNNSVNTVVSGVLVKANGSLASVSLPDSSETIVDATGLAKGGWFVRTLTKGHFISATGAVVGSIDLPSGVALLALSNGGLAITGSESGAVSVVYTAAGVRLSQGDATAVMASQHVSFFSKSFDRHNSGIEVRTSDVSDNDDDTVMAFQIAHGDKITPSLFPVFSNRSQSTEYDAQTGAFRSSQSNSASQTVGPFLPSARGEFVARLNAHQNASTSQFDGTVSRQTSNTSSETSVNVVRREFAHASTGSSEVSDVVLTPALLRTAPGQRNGSVLPPTGVDPVPTPGDVGAGGSGAGGGAGAAAPVTPVAPVSPNGTSRLELPPPPQPIVVPKSPGASVKPGSGIEASIVTSPTADGGRQELLDAAADVVEHELGPAMADKFRQATTPEERGVILQGAANAQVLGRELYDIVKGMDPEMSEALFEGWSVLQQAGLEQEPGVSQGLLDALTIKRDGGTNEDGSPGVPRTALEVPLNILQAEMYQAKTPEDRARVRNLVTRELLLAGRAEAGLPADDTADLVLTDVAGKQTRITPEGELIRE